MAMSCQKALALIVSGLFVCQSFPLDAQSEATLRFTAPAIAAYQQINRLELASAHAALQTLSRTDKENRIIDFLQFELDFLSAMVTERPEIIDQFQRSSQQRINRVRQIRSDAPWRGHCLGEMYMMRGILAYKRRDYLNAASDIRKGHQAIQSGLKQFPRFLPARRDQAILSILIGTVPDRYQWAVEWLSGIEGQSAAGYKTLQQVRRTFVKQGHFLATETVFLEALLAAQVIGNRPEGYALVQSMYEKDPRHPFILFLYSSLAQESGQNNETIRLLTHRLPNPQQIPFPYLDYLLGKAHLYVLDLGGAEVAIHSFLDHWAGTTNRADALQKLAWCALLKGNTSEYTRLMHQCRQIEGGVSEGDKQAQLDALLGYIPHVELLQARLLFDGGYLDRAGRTLEQIDPATLEREIDQLEYHYRAGRIAQSSGEPEKAIRAFKKCWSEGQGSIYHVACASALQLGHLFLEMGDRDAARMWFVRCLEEDPDRYRDGLHQKAKAGLMKVDL